MEVDKMKVNTLYIKRKSDEKGRQRKKEKSKEVRNRVREKEQQATSKGMIPKFS